MKRIGLLVVTVLVAGCSSSASSPGGSAGDKSPTLNSVPYDMNTIPYGIYVGLIYTGAPCSPYTNSGYFSQLAYDSEFHNVVFVPPSSSGLPGPYGALLDGGSDMQAGVAFQQVHGEGKVSSYSFCPMYETETDSYPCAVIEGPHEFLVTLSVVQPQGGEGSATLRFQATSKEVGQPIMRWDGKIGTGEWGGAGSADNAFFTTTWAELIAGDEFGFETTVPGGDGESWNWSIRFIPEVR